jgi:hypothetical protein
MRKVFLAIPSHSGKLRQGTQTAVSCFHLECASLGWTLQEFRWHNDSLIVHARNACAAKFLETDCTDFFFLDDDVAVGPGVFTRLMSHPVDMVGVAYRLKKDEEAYAVNHISQDPQPDANGLLEVYGMPFGMVRMKRSVIERMVEANKDAWFMASGVPDLKCYLLFNTELWQNKLIGEDMYFCKKFRDIEGKVYLDADIPIQHISADDKVYAGHYGNYLRKRKAAVALKAVA